MPAHSEPPAADLERSAPVPVLLLGGLLALVAAMLVVVGTPPVVAVLLAALAGAVLVGRAEHVMLRELRARVGLPAERAQLRSVSVQVGALCAAADVPEPELLIGGEGVADVTPVARTRRASTLVLSESLLAQAPADRAAPLARAVAEVALGHAEVRTVAGAPGALGATLVSRALLAVGRRRRDEAADLVAGRLVGAARSGAPSRPAVPYRDFVKA
ncbi:hypothetical protein GKE82_22640 [Conexibacter sp. W3-3-2]|uniref:hypothetical protein n=1 Tax=Conexibacter sp. W3-3-2 TaxID=2675227 RepID=UPI0012B7939B|nr:hypothetical protein [Conexibacter sp. W3-3-2]MTD47008.1 hypothetical protein [Conexibacter sp. W3-3-2]